MLTPCVMSTAKHVVVLWREGGISDPDETVQAYMDAARQFENQSDLLFSYIDTAKSNSLGGAWGYPGGKPMAQYYTTNQAQPRGEKLPLAYLNPNVMAGVVIDPGFIASELKRAMQNAKVAILEAACKDEEAVCGAWAKAGECKNNPGFMLQKCKRSCLDDGMESACPGVTSSVPKEPSCYDKSGAEDCGIWAEDGECEKNPDFMHKSCRHSCKQCTMTEEDRQLDRMRIMMENEIANKAAEAKGYHQQLADERESELRMKAGAY